MNELETQYCTIMYDAQHHISEFNDNIRMNYRLKSKVPNLGSLPEEEVMAKVDFLVEKVECELEIFPDPLHIHIVLLENKKAVSNLYYERYNKKVEYKAFYSLSLDTIFISVKDASTKMFAHELGHCLIDKFCPVRLPSRLHELIAQYAEKHVLD